MNLDIRARELLSDLTGRFPLGYEPLLVWKSFRVTAGMAYYKEGTIALSKRVIVEESQLEDTLIHEYAHLLAVARHGRKAAGHGAPWRQAMFDLGREPKVRHTYEVQRNERRQEVAYACQRCGTVIVRARRLPRRRKYSHLGCGGAIKFAWARAVE